MKKVNQELRNLIHRARRRTLAQNLIAGTFLVLPVVIGGLGLLSITGQLIPQSSLLPILALVTFASVLVLFAIRAGRGLNEFRLAKSIDDRNNLDDRITSALEFSRLDQRTEFMDAQIRNASTQQVDFQSTFPIWPGRVGKKLIIALALLPLLGLGTLVDLTPFAPKPHTDLARLPIEPVPVDVPEAPDLDPIRAPKALAPLIDPVRNYINAWKKNVQKIAAEKARRQKEFERMRTEAIHAASADAADQAKINSVKNQTYAITDDKIHLSDLASMGINSPAEYKQVFEELDKMVFENAPEVENIQSWADNMVQTADRKSTQGKQLGLDGAMAMAGDPATQDDMFGFRKAMQGAQQESFNEFLRNFGQHLSDVADAKKKHVAQAKQTGQRHKQQLTSAPPPPDAKLKLVKLDPQMKDQVQLAPMSSPDSAKKLVKGQTPSDSKAGKGGGTAEGVIKVDQLEAETRYMELKNRLGEGRSPLQILEDIDSVVTEDFSAEQYRLLYVDYTEGASQLLESEKIPVSIKSYIREYFLSINPDEINIEKERKEHTDKSKSETTKSKFERRIGF